jgi:hypothetical protein
VSVVIADGANREFMIYHELFRGLSIMSLSQRKTVYHEFDKFMPALVKLTTHGSHGKAPQARRGIEF